MNQRKMPILFIGHGSPLNALENNNFTDSWSQIGKLIEKPKAILMISAHWITEEKTLISTSEKPGMIYDMYGFPAPLYNLRYPAPGKKEQAEKILKELKDAIPSQHFHADDERGFDHGVWSTLIHMFPDADIPVICLSLDYLESPTWHYKLGQALGHLRDQGVLIIGSGNIVHNLRMIDWNGKGRGHSWANEFDTLIAKSILDRDDKNILSCLSWDITPLAHPTHDHLLPLFSLLGAVRETDTVEFYTPLIVMGSISMRSVVWH